MAFEATGMIAEKTTQRQQVGWLVLSGLGFVGLVAAITRMANGPVELALISGIVCWVSAVLAYLVSQYPQGEEFILLRLALGSAMRTGPPLLIAVWLVYFRTPPVDKSFVFFIILFYLAGLAVDSWLSLARLKSES